MKTPITSWPCCLSSHAATDESTPPERPMTMRCLDAIRVAYPIKKAAPCGRCLQFATRARRRGLLALLLLQRLVCLGRVQGALGGCRSSLGRRRRRGIFLGLGIRIRIPRLDDRVGFGLLPGASGLLGRSLFLRSHLGVRSLFCGGFGLQLGLVGGRRRCFVVRKR